MTVADTCQVDQTCVSESCQCDTINGTAYQLTCSNGQRVCGGWGFETVGGEGKVSQGDTTEGWYVMSGQVTLSVVSRGGSRQLAIAIPNDQIFWIAKDICGGTSVNNGPDTTGKTLSFTLDSDTSLPSSNDAILASITDQGGSQPFGNQFFGLPPAYHYAGTAITAGQNTTQIILEFQISDPLPANGATIYVDNIVLK